MTVSQNNQYNMKKFEYKVLTFGYGMIPDEQRLNELGQSGWELTGMIVDSEKKISNFFFKKEVDQKQVKTRWNETYLQDRNKGQRDNPLPEKIGVHVVFCWIQSILLLATPDKDNTGLDSEVREG